MTTSTFLKAKKPYSFVVFYGSQTGQAESISETIVEQAQNNDFVSEAFPLNEIKDVKDLTRLECPIVIVTSTTGDGEPPENADRFWRKVRKRNLGTELLSVVNYTLLGLGDTNYNQFCNCGKEINRRLQDLGARTFLAPAWADDAVGLETVVEDWLDNLWESLGKLLRPGTALTPRGTSMEGGLHLPICPPSSLSVEVSEDLKVVQVDLEDPILPYPLIDGIPVKAVIVDARELTKVGATKLTLEVTLKFLSGSFDFEPGDAISIVCPNSPFEVNRLIRRLTLDDIADKVVSVSLKEGSKKGKIPQFVPPGISIRQYFHHYGDIRATPKKAFLRLLADYTEDASEKNDLLELCSREGAEKFEKVLRFPSLSLLDILLTFPSCTPPPSVFIEHLPRLIPRPYSISSTPLRQKDSFTVAFNVVKFTEEEGRKYPRAGICTGWLYDKGKEILGKNLGDGHHNDVDELSSKFPNLSLDSESTTSDSEVVIFKRKNQNFRLPSNLSSPVVMVGPGTGVAPFIGFLEHRGEQKKSGHSIGDLCLYFGCRNKELDFLYENQLTTLCEERILSKLYTSFSRDDDQEEIKYVQHNMEKHKEELVKLVFEDQGYFYVCGDAKNMAKNVRESLIECVKTVKGLSDDDAKAAIAGLVSEKRYIQDVWT